MQLGITNFVENHIVQSLIIDWKFCGHHFVKSWKMIEKYLIYHFVNYYFVESRKMIKNKKLIIL